MKLDSNIVKLALVVSMSTLVSASSLSGISFGGSSTSFNSEDKRGGVYVGFDGFTEPAKGFAIGIGGDVNTFKTQTNGLAKGNSAYTMGAQLKAGYTFKEEFDIPLRLKAGYGYGVSRIIDENAWGTQYDLAIEYSIYKNYGIGYKYKSTNADLNSKDINIKASMLYLSISVGE